MKERAKEKKLVKSLAKLENRIGDLDKTISFLVLREEILEALDFEEILEIDNKHLFNKRKKVKSFGC